MDLRVDIEEEIREKHFLRYSDYCEIKLLVEPGEYGKCYRCNKSLEPLTYLDPDFYYIPCWECSNKKKTEREMMIESIKRNIKDYYNKIQGDRYFQLFIVDDIYYKTTLTHTYEEFKKIIISLDPPSRNDIWFLDWKPGYPKIITQENILGLKLVNLTDHYSNLDIKPDHIKIGSYEISMPEIIDFDFKRQSRYSIFNKKGDRKRKRVIIDDKCYRLYNTEDENVKSIFKVTKNGEEITTRSIPYQDYVILKLAIMRNKNFTRLIFDLIMESLDQCGILRDSIFLKNSVPLDPKKQDTCLNLIWTSISEFKNIDYTNISII
jgi:hypothetical protein